MSWKQTALLVGAAALAFAAGRAVPWNEGVASAQPATKDKAAQPGQPAKPDRPAAQPETDPMAAWMAKMQPGPNHKVLDAMLGNWEGGVKFWMAPGGETMESKGSVHREWQMDGRFLVEHVEGVTEGQPPFKGLGLLGYNTVENRYESVWVENMATYVTFMTGTYDAAKKSMTFTGDMIDPMTGKRAKQRHVLDMSDPNKETMVGYGIGPDGKEFKNFEGTFTKKK